MRLGENEVADACAVSLKHFVRIGQLRSLQEKKADPAGIDCDRKNRLRGFLAGPEADRQRIVVVIHEFDCARQSLAKARKRRTSGCRNPWFEFCQEGSKLLCGSSQMPTSYSL
jgi:predicted aminopeptidase